MFYAKSSTNLPQGRKGVGGEKLPTPFFFGIPYVDAMTFLSIIKTKVTDHEERYHGHRR